MAISPLELRHIIESAFLPMQCRCTCNTTGEIAVEIVDPETGNNLTVGGIAVAELNTARAICELVGELRMRIRERKPATWISHA
ncbi:DUF1652 domain-containing protein [Pseudomonas sp. NPDC090208]|uniref:DUF1652 domain-containing protein n=1 Tax=Pseudomonas sp. NPDC090208 TaxID=3364478 RepID=UPI0038184D73